MKNPKIIISVVMVLLFASVAYSERYPDVGGDYNDWGDILNGLLQVCIAQNGSLKAECLVGYQNETMAWKEANTSSYMSEFSYLNISNATAIAGLMQNSTINRSIDLSSYALIADTLSLVTLDNGTVIRTH